VGLSELVSVIITTYNRENALDAVLRGLGRQTDRNFEIIVADDGSGAATRDLVEQRLATMSIPVSYAWQEDRGFRAGEARNRGIVMSRGTYCIFLDGDCIPRPSFIAQHRRLAEAGWFVTGNRVLLSQELSQSILDDGNEAELWGLPMWIGLRRQGKVNRLAPLLPLRLGPLRKLRPGSWRGARSCNLGVWRQDLEHINGFDTSYSGWGLEDSDLLIRLLHAGRRRKDGTFATGVLHLWHPDNDRSHLAENQRRLDATQKDNRVRATAGLSALAGIASSDAVRQRMGGHG
jgi:glycosyltransferase involved in cell wall biosynthesis